MKSAHLKYMNSTEKIGDADIVLFGCPFDGTCSYRPGTRFAPPAIRQTSFGLESYSPVLDRDLENVRFYDAGDLDLGVSNSQFVVKQIYDETKSILDKGKLPAMLGGEHAVTYPVVKALVEKHPRLRVIHFDAHADLRDDYLGQPLSHACVIRRILDFLPVDCIYQFGIRSGTAREWEFMRHHGTVFPADIASMQQVVSKIKNYPVYITVDLDVFDPGLFPGTGTPEPGGIDFTTFSSLVREMANLNQIVGFDAVELSPPWDHSGVSDVVAAKVVRELLLITGRDHKKPAH